ncbi:MAG: chemotaxis response regulator protein-glutamate methylesterase [Anaerolineales bacterium]|nr:chemotaxis response regulator protein-glutamate methylesterase [Anaerolineales bacterium]
MAGQVAAAGSPVRVLVVDDSAFMRFTIAKHLGEVPSITIVGTARNGGEALELIPKLKPDVVTLDVEMPHMDGLTTLREIMSRHPLPVVMLSSLTKEGAWETVQALTLGAVDFVTKPDTKANIAAVIDDVVAKVQQAAQAKVFAFRQMPPVSVRILPVPSYLVNEGSQPPHQQKTTRPLTSQVNVLVIGSSTGGPRALNIVVPDLSANIPAAVLIVQHMPVGFTRSLAERLDAISQLAVKEATPGDKLEVRRALVAPGGFHMMVDDSNQITLNQSPPVHGVRPSVDVTMISAAQRYGVSVVGAILTGMGCDGTNAAKLVRNAGGWIIAEDKSTLVVWGMPRSVFEAGAANEVVPLHEVASAVHKAISTHH